MCFSKPWLQEEAEATGRKDSETPIAIVILEVPQWDLEGSRPKKKSVQQPKQGESRKCLFMQCFVPLFKKWMAQTSPSRNSKSATLWDPKASRLLATWFRQFNCANNSAVVLPNVGLISASQPLREAKKTLKKHWYEPHSRTTSLKMCLLSDFGRFGCSNSRLLDLPTDTLIPLY